MEILMTIAGKVAEHAVDYTVAPLARQVGYLIFYKGNVENLKDQVENLKKAKDSLSLRVQTEERNGRQRTNGVKDWMGKVDEILNGAEQLYEDPRHRNAGCCKGPFPNLKSRHQLSRRATKMAGSIADIIKEKDGIDSLTSLPNLEPIGSTSATSSDKLESRKKMKEDIVLALRNPNLSRIGIYGLGGVGKTTLVKEISKQVKDDKLFDEVVMVRISQDANLERIQREVADFLGLNQFEEVTLVTKASRLSQRIKSEKSILVILDDVWEILELDKLGIPVNDHKGCKLLLTTRNQGVLQKMDTQKDFLIDVLKEEEAWSLFQNMVGDIATNVRFRELAFQVAQRCAGLNVLIVTVARALKNKDEISFWEEALDQLKTVDKEGMNGIIYSALEFSYSHLESNEVKDVFLLCGLQGPQIYFEHLLKCVMGLGLFKNTHTTKGARLKLLKLIDSLRSSCLLLESNSHKLIKMHDIVHEVATSLASRVHHICKSERVNEIWPSEKLLQRCTQNVTFLILDGCHISQLPERLECPNIKFFSFTNVNKSLSIPNSFFEVMRNLKVLYLSDMTLPSLPQSFHSLSELQTLILHLCVLGEMSNIGALTNLRILGLNASSMITLPSELGQLTDLRMLDLSDAGIEIFPPNILSNLTNLEELSLGNTCTKWNQEYSNEESKIASLTELRYLSNLTSLAIQIRGAWVLPRGIKFDKVERYKIVIGDIWEWYDNHEVFKTLKLKLDTGCYFAPGIEELIKGVESLYLDGVDEISNVLYDLSVEGFPFLKHLHIQNNESIQHIINSKERKQSHHVFFPELETLMLQNLKILEKICHGPITDDSFARLRSVKVQCCSQLRYLFSVSMVKVLYQLVEIEVSECNFMKKIVYEENSYPTSSTDDDTIQLCSLQSLSIRYSSAIEDFYSGLSISSTSTLLSSLHNNVPSSFFNAKVRFSNLETLKLSSIDVENIWQDDHFSVANSFHKLANLSVEKCHGLKYLFSSSMDGCFSNLKQLEIKECEMMEEIIGTKRTNGAAIEEVGLPKLESVAISNMKSLKKVWYSQFEGLKTMEVNNCEKLENIFSYDMNTTLGRMETLVINDCGSVKEIFKLPAHEIYSGEDTQLKKLHLLHLPKLKQIWSKDPQGDFGFHNLQDIDVQECKNLEYLFPFSIALGLQQLEKLYVDCHGMKEIVAKKEGPIDEKPKFHFDRLYSLNFEYIHQLDRFYDGSYSLRCQSLRKLSVGMNFANLKLFGKKSTGNHMIKNAVDQNQCLSTQEPIFIIEEVIPKLEEWKITKKELTTMMQDLQWKDHYLSELKHLQLVNYEFEVSCLDLFVQNAPNLEYLLVHDNFLKEIFRDKRVIHKEGNMNGIKTRLKTLFLVDAASLQHICREGCQVDPILEVLDCLWVTECSNLKTLVPSSVNFPHLTTLYIHKCNGLINLIYSSTAVSLVNLRSISVKECCSLEEIVTQGGMNETRDEIVLRSLMFLRLESLPRLNSFSSSHCFFRFPFLFDVVVRQCPRMKAFSEGKTSTPMLRKVKTKEGENEEWCWEGNLNRTTKKIYADKIAFRDMEHFDLSLYLELGGSWNSPAENKIFCNLKSLVVQQCDFLSDVLIPSNLLRALVNLEEIQVGNCDSLKVVFEFEAAKEEAISKKEACNLRTICLSNLPKLQYIWKPNLVGQREDDDEVQTQRQQPLSLIAKVLLPKLETLTIEEIEDLEAIWHPVLIPNSIGSFHTLKVKKCHKIKHIFPYMHGAFATLKTLTVEECNSVQEIFKLEVNAMCSGDPQSSLQFKDLQLVHVENCEVLEYLFPFSIAKNLPLLEEIKIKYSKRIKEIVSKTEEPFDDPVKFEFNKLTSLELWNLPYLQGFCSVNHRLSCASLKKLDVWDCEKLKLFKTRGTSSQERPSDDDNVHVSIQQPHFTPKEVVGNLEQLILSSDGVRNILQEQFSGIHFSKLEFFNLHDIEDDQMTFPYWFLQNITYLDNLSVWRCPFTEIFAEEATMDLEGKMENRTQIKTLYLSDLHELQNICKEGCEINHVIDSLYVIECSSLKHLVPSSVTFGHLTSLEVQRCKGMIHLIASSTATSLVQLKTLKIRGCNSMEKIVVEDNKGGDTENEIAFNNLQVLELESLPKLKMFCSGSTNCCLKLPVLEKLVIKQCARMDSFSARETRAPMLQKVLIDEQNGIWYWKGDLTRTVNKMFQDKVALSSFNYLELSEYPELKELWYGQISYKIFCNLKHLVVRKCTFLSNMLFSSNQLQLLYTLEELEVAECDSLEAIFDVKALDDIAIESKEVSGLKKLTLSKLQNLKLIWNRAVEEIMSFGNLQIVKVDKCQHLKYLFSVSPCHDLSQLEELHVESCDGVEEIVSTEEEGVDELKFDFPRLTTLELFNLTRLTNFYPRRHILECPSLKSLNVRGCEELQIFAFDHFNPQLLRESKIELKTTQALFYIEKVSQNLEELPLNEKDTVRILNGSYGKNLFHSIHRLRLQYFCETPIKFLDDLIQKFPAATTLQVRCSNSLKILFPSEEIGHCSIESATQIKTLWLYQLGQLEHIWSDDDSASHPLVPNLQYLYIQDCPRLRRLALPLTCFTNLTSMFVEDCNGLMHFMSSFTAKSLVHLTYLTVRNCDMLEEVVVTNEGGLSKEEIMFKSLKYLELTYLLSFKSFCFGNHTFIFPSLVTMKVIGCHEMQNFSYGVIVAPFLKLVEVENGKKRWKENLNTTIKQLFVDNKEIGGAEGDNIESSSIIQRSQNSVGTSRVLNFEKKEIQNVINILHTGSDTPKSYEIAEPPLDQVDAALGTEDLITTHQGTLSPAIFQDTDIDTGTKEMHETIPNGEDVSIIPVSTQDIATETHVKRERFDKPFEKEAHGSDFPFSNNLFNQTTTSMAADYKEPAGNGKKYESRRSFSVHDAQNILGKPDEPQITSDMKEVRAPIDASLSYQDLEAVISSIQHEGKSDEPRITPGNNLSCQTTNSAMAENIAAPSQASSSSSSATPIADTCSSFKELDISIQLLPYLEAGVKRHPQVLNWLNTKRRKVFASSSLSLFAEVTRILRTTRRVDLTEDDQNYIRECCAVLQGVGVDDGWISYVHGRIEKCGNDEEDLEWKIDEAEAQIESMKKEANKLHGYIYLSMLINALLFTILFFIIIYVYQKNN